MKAKWNGGILVQEGHVRESILVHLEVVVIPGKLAKVSQVALLSCKQPGYHLMWQQDPMLHIDGGLCFGVQNGQGNEVGLRSEELVGGLHLLHIPHDVPAQVLEVFPMCTTPADMCHPLGPSISCQSCNLMSC